MLFLFLLMLVAFYLAMGRFTRWLDQIRSATARIAYLRPGGLPSQGAFPWRRTLNAIRQQFGPGRPVPKRWNSAGRI